MNLLQLFNNLELSLDNINKAQPNESDYMKLKRGQKTPEMIAKRKKTMRKDKILRFQMGFLSCNNYATSNALTTAIEMTRDAINYDLKMWEKEGITKRVGSIHNPYGKSSFIWSWNFSLLPLLSENIKLLNKEQLECLNQNQAI